jgi:hypothetical protein
MIHALYQYLEVDNNNKLAPSLPLIHIHKRALFLQRVTQDTQIYHLAVSIVLYIFGSFITPSNDAAHQEFTQKIFGHCSKKKMFLCGLFDLLLYFNNNGKIKLSYTFITNLLVHPEAILNKVHNQNMGIIDWIQSLDSPTSPSKEELKSQYSVLIFWIFANVRSMSPENKF